MKRGPVKVRNLGRVTLGATPVRVWFDVASQSLAFRFHRSRRVHRVSLERIYENVVLGQNTFRFFK